MGHDIKHVFCCPAERPSKTYYAKIKKSTVVEGIGGKFLKDLLCMNHCDCLDQGANEQWQMLC